MRWLLLLTLSVSARKPHVLIIIADDLGWNDIGVHNPFFQTPNIDALLGESLKLNNYYVQPICTPTRSVMLSGRYQIHTGLQHGVILASQTHGFPLSDILLPEQLKQCGYRNHLVGKWHMGYARTEMLPENRGFETHFGYLNGAEDHYDRSVCVKTHFKNKPGFCGIDFRDNGANRNITAGVYSADLYTERIERIVSEHDRDEPLFLYAALQNVHFPLEAPEKYLEHYKWINNHDRRVYAAMTMALDESIGRIVAAFKEKNLWEETIVYFTTDNGGSSLYGGNNYPYRGIKATNWEGGIKGIGSLKVPNVKPGPRSQLIHVSDIFPTLSALTKCIPCKKDRAKWDGVDQSLSLVGDSPSSRREFLINIDPLTSSHGADNRQWNTTFDVHVKAGLRWNQWKLLTGDPGGPDNHVYPPELDNKPEKLRFVPEKRPVVEDDFSVGSKWNKRVALFDIESDPLELVDQSDTRRDIVEFMLKKLESYNASAVPVQWSSFDYNANPNFHGGFWQPWILTP